MAHLSGGMKFIPPLPGIKHFEEQSASDKREAIRKKSFSVIRSLLFPFFSKFIFLKKSQRNPDESQAVEYQ